jgi:hypothetical protein
MLPDEAQIARQIRKNSSESLAGAAGRARAK